MIKGVYAVKDVKTSFWPPHVQVNDVAARREFENLVNSSHNEFMQQNYADCELWKLGEYDDQTGAIVSDPVFICSGVDVKKVIE